MIDAALGAPPRRAVVSYDPQSGGWIGHVLPPPGSVVGDLDRLSPAALAVALLSALGGLAAGYAVVGPAALPAGAHEALAAVEIARRLAGDRHAVPITLATLALDLELLRATAPPSAGSRAAWRSATGWTAPSSAGCCAASSRTRWRRRGCCTSSKRSTERRGEILKIRNTEPERLKALRTAYIETTARRRSFRDRQKALLDRARDADAKAAKLRAEADTLRTAATSIDGDLARIDQALAAEERATASERTAALLREAAAELDDVARGARNGHEAIAYLSALERHRRELLLEHLRRDKTARCLLLDWLATVVAGGRRMLRADGHIGLPIPLAGLLSEAQKQGRALANGLEEAVEQARRLKA